MSPEELFNRDVQRALTCIDELKIYLADIDFTEAVKSVMKHAKSEVKFKLAKQGRRKLGYRKTTKKVSAECGYTDLLKSTPNLDQAFKGKLLQEIRSDFAKGLSDFIKTFQQEFAAKLNIDQKFVEAYGCPRIAKIAEHLILKPQDDNDHISNIYSVSIEHVTAIEGMIYIGEEIGHENILKILTRIKYWQRHNTAQGKKLSLIELQRLLLFEHNYYDKKESEFGVQQVGFTQKSVKTAVKQLYSCMKIVATNPLECSRDVLPYAIDLIKVDHELIRKTVDEVQRGNPDAQVQDIINIVSANLPEFSTEHIEQVMSGQFTSWYCEESLCR